MRKFTLLLACMMLFASIAAVHVFAAEDTSVTSTEELQAALDNATTGTTIQLAPNVNYGTVYVRPTASNETTMYCGTHDYTTTDAEAFKAHLAEKVYHTTPKYTTTFDDVTIVGAEGATVAGMLISSGHVVGPAYDYVRDMESVSGSLYYCTLNLSNLTFKNVSFTAQVNINTSDADSVYDGVTFDGCSFTTGGTASANGAAIRYYNEANNGNVKNIVVKNSTFTNCYQGVYVHHVNGIAVTDCEFDTTGHNAIAVQNHDGAVDLKELVITGNTFKNVADRIIRFNEVGADSNITIKDNVAINSGDDDNEVIKANSIAAGVTTSIENNNWGEGKTVYNEELRDPVKTLISGTGTAEDPFIIDSLDALKEFRDNVNGGITYDNQYIKLTTDIDLQGEAWTPIGSITNKFLGTFDGSEKTISNLTVNVEADHAGLFGYASVIKNVKIHNATVTGWVQVGALVGELENSVGTLDNCHVTGTIQITGENSVGGLAGKGYANIKNCSVDGTDAATSFVQGVVNDREGSEEGDNIGGVMGHLGEGNTLGMVNSTAKNLTVKGTRKVGGVVGTTARANDYIGNTAENLVIECTATAEYADDNATTTTIGGIIGGYFGSATQGGILQNSTVKNVTLVIGNAKSAGALVGGDRNNGGGAPVGVEASGNVVENVTGATNSYLLPALVKIGNTEFATLADAIAAVKAGEEILLVGDVAESVTAPAGVTINLNGKSIDGTVTALGDITFKGDGSVKTLKNIEGGVITVEDGKTLALNNFSFGNKSTAGREYTITGGKITANYGFFQHGTYALYSDFETGYMYYSFGSDITVYGTFHSQGKGDGLDYVRGTLTVAKGGQSIHDKSLWVGQPASWGEMSATLIVEEGGYVKAATLSVYGGSKLVIDTTGMKDGDTVTTVEANTLKMEGALETLNGVDEATASGNKITVAINTPEPKNGLIDDRFYVNDAVIDKIYALHEYEGKTYYISDGYMILKDGVAYVDGEALYFGADGALISGKTLVEIDGVTYAYENGTRSDVIYNVFTTDDGKTYYVGDAYAVSKIAQNIFVAGDLMVFGENGVRFTGNAIVEVNGAYYAFVNGVRSNVIYDLFTTDDGKTYYIGDAYQVVTTAGEIWVNGKLMAFGDDGALLSGNTVVEIGGTYYAFTNGVRSNEIYTTFETADGTYYIGDAYAIVTDTVIWIDAKPTYFGTDGKMQTGTFILNDNVYVNGEMVKAYQLVKIGEDYYYVSDGHKIARSTSIYINDPEITPEARYYEVDANGIVQLP